MAGPIRISVLANGSQASRTFRTLGGDADAMGSKFSRATRNLAIGAGLAVAARAVVGFGKSVVSASSDAQQSLGATETVFGRFASTVEKTSDRAAERFGLSANEYRNSANLIGSLFANQGVATDELASKSRAMIATAADLAATFGGPTSDAVAALGSAFKGEFDPLERYGISLKQSTVNTEALRVANVKTTAQFDALSAAEQAAAKQRATSNLITRQGAKAAGAFARETDTLANRQQVLGAKFENVKAKIGTAFLPIVTDAFGYVADEAIPVLEDFAGWLGENSDEIGATAREIAATFLPTLKITGEVLQTVVGFAASLPGPIREIAATAAAAAIVLPRLTSAVGAVTGGLGGMVGGLRNAETRTAALSGVARNLAGVGGLVAVTQSAGETNKALSAVGTVAGAAALGFSVGGPWGAAIGAVGGLGVAVYDAARDSDDLAAATDGVFTAYEGAVGAISDYTATLDAATGAISRATRAEVLASAQREGVIALANRLDISTRDLIGSVLGQEGATRRLSRAYAANFTLLGGTEQARFNGFLQENTRALAQQREAVAADSRTLSGLSRVLKGLPEKAITEVRQLGATASQREIARLRRAYDLTPKQVRAIVSVVGTEATVRKVDGVAEIIERTGDTTTDLNPFIQSLKSNLDVGRRSAQDGSRDIADNLRKGTGTARADLSVFSQGIAQTIGTNKSLATSGGTGIGFNLKSGVITGLNGFSSDLATLLTAGVRDAIAAARREAQIKSPSRKTMEIGRQLGRGMVVGLAREKPATTKAARSLVGSLVAGVKRGSSGVSNELDKITESIRRGIEKATKSEKAARERTKAALRSLDAEFDRLRRNGKAQDANTKGLERARQRLEGLRAASASYAESVRTGAQGFASVVNLDTAFNADALLAGLRSRLGKLQQFNATLGTLIGRGLNSTIVDQLAAAGVEGGLATAVAIEQGGASAVREFNALQGEINATATRLGDRTAGVMFDAGIKGANGLVRGLEAKGRDLDQAATRLARRLSKALTKALREAGVETPNPGGSAGGGTRARIAPLDARQVYAASPGGQTNTYQINIRADATTDKVALGRNIVSAIEAYEARGGRKRAA